METNNKHFKIPEDYFSNMEDRVMFSFYKNKRKERRLKILKVMSVVAVVLVVGCVVKFLPYNSINENIQKESLYSKLIDSGKEGMTTKSKVYSSTEKKQSNILEKQRNNEKKQRNSEKNIRKNKSIKYSEAELRYLEQYIREDSYELLTNK